MLVLLLATDYHALHHVVYIDVISQTHCSTKHVPTPKLILDELGRRPVHLVEQPALHRIGKTLKRLLEHSTAIRVQAELLDVADERVDDVLRRVESDDALRRGQRTWQPR